MSNRSVATLGLVMAFAAAPAFAAGDGFVNLDNDAGSQFVSAPGGKTRAEVVADLQGAPSGAWTLTEASPAPAPAATRAGFTSTLEQARLAQALDAEPMPSDIGRDLGGEAGWVFERP